MIKKALFIIGAIVALPIVYAIAMVSISMSRSTSKLDQTQRELAPLVAALESYKEKAGSYPERLEQLVPAQLPKVPSCPAPFASFPDIPPSFLEAQGGLRYSYAKGAPRYGLSCFMGMAVFPQTGVYDSESKTWTILD